MGDTTASIQRIIEVGGTALPHDIDSQLESATVIDRLTMPDMFTLVFRDPERDILGKAHLEIGAKVKVSTTSTSETAPKPLIDGEVTSVETECGTHGTLAVVRGYDMSHRLTAGRKSETYLNTKYSDIASKIGNAAGLTPDVDETDGTFEHVFQANQSDLDFLYGLARQIGYDCRVDGQKLLFKKPVESSTGPAEGDASSTDATQLVFGAGLTDFRARMSSVAQVSNVEVRGWDPKEKKEIIGTSAASASHVDLPMKVGELGKKAGDRTHVVVDHGVKTQQEAEQVAAAYAEQHGSAAYQATGIAVGSPLLKSGVAVSIAGVDPALSGKWVISGTRHELGDGMYRTHLEFAGRQDSSLPGLMTQGGNGGRDKIYGVVVAIVTGNDDPEQMGRVKVKFPWLTDSSESWWARVAAPGAGNGYGVTWLPQVDDEVLVGFLQGDPQFPYVIGGLWNGLDKVPFDYGAGLDAGSVTYCGFTSRTGHQIAFFESSSESSIQLLTKGGTVNIVLDEQNSQLKIEVKGKVQLAADGDVEIKAGGSMKLEATGQMTIKGATVAIN